MTLWFLLVMSGVNCGKAVQDRPFFCVLKWAFYSASITDFLAASPEEVLGRIVENDEPSKA
jgi:hypothetical protein